MLGWDARHSAHDSACRCCPSPAATAAGRGGAHRAALLRHAARSRDVRQAASGGCDAAGSCAGVAPLCNACRRCSK
eukprot:6876785-Alexandrium_andersonii.AAC.1